MSGIGGQEFLLLCLIGLLILGPERLPRVASQIGSWVGKARQMTRSLRRQLEEEISAEKNLGFDPNELKKSLERKVWMKRGGFLVIDEAEALVARAFGAGRVDRLRRGEQNLLWPTEIKWFAKSSGTTAAKSKFIPVSNEALEDCHFRGGKDIIAFYRAATALLSRCVCY